MIVRGNFALGDKLFHKRGAPIRITFWSPPSYLSSNFNLYEKEVTTIWVRKSTTSGVRNIGGDRKLNLKNKE